jgi:hypothetical protein
MMPPRTAAVLWRRIDRPGHESARLIALEAGWELAGTSVFAHEGEACCLSSRSTRAVS